MPVARNQLRDLREHDGRRDTKSDETANFKLEGGSRLAGKPAFANRPVTGTLAGGMVAWRRFEGLQVIGDAAEQQPAQALL